MGREIRRVIPNWEHPKYTERDAPFPQSVGCYKPLLNRDYPSVLAEWNAQNQLWEDGEHPDQDKQSAKSCRTYADWEGEAPKPEWYRPAWKAEEMTWYQVYETVSEGTPQTPPFATLEEIVIYLSTLGEFCAQEEGTGPITVEQARAFVSRGRIPTMVIGQETEKKAEVLLNYQQL